MISDGNSDLQEQIKPVTVNKINRTNYVIYLLSFLFSASLIGITLYKAIILTLYC